MSSAMILLDMTLVRFAFFLFLVLFGFFRLLYVLLARSLLGNNYASFAQK